MKKRGTILVENVIFIILNLLFLIILILFIAKQGSGAIIVEQSYAKQIALLIDSAKPISIIELNMDQVEATEYMRKTAKDFGHNLAYGVGNDMSTAFYTHINNQLVQFWPDGHNGQLVLIHIKPHMCEECQE